MNALDLIEALEDEYGKELDSIEYNDDDGACFLISLREK